MKVDMKYGAIPILVVCFFAGALLAPESAEPAGEGAVVEDVFATIGSGDYSGVYFPAGLAIAKRVNNRRDHHRIRATVEATPGAVFNLNAIAAGYMEFGITQADKEYQAVNGLAEWAESGPQEKLRSVFSLHHESLTLVAAVDAGIDSLSDLKGKRVSTGNPGSASQHRIVMDALDSVGIDPARDIFAHKVMASDAPALLQDNRLDAFFYTVGHPSEIVLKALSGERKARIVPIFGPSIDRMIAGNKMYSRSAIPVKRLYPDLIDNNDIETFGVIATLCTSSDVPAEVVYALVKEVFENLETLREEHPAFSHLTREGMLQGLSAPLHPGALGYYKEAGLAD